jgi:hypothetical protein
MHQETGYDKERRTRRALQGEPEEHLLLPSMFLELPHSTKYTMPMYGKNRKRYLKIFSWLLAIVVIVGMLTTYFSLLV